MASATTASDTRALHILGRRLERLFIIGFALVLLSFVELYLATASAFFSRERPISYLNTLISKIAPEQQRLQTLFDSEQSIAKQLDRYADTRKRLGLPLQLPSKVELAKHPYANELRKMIENAATATDVRPQKYADLIDFTKPPSSVLDSLRSSRQQHQDTPAKIWGIDTPELFSIEYSRVNYKVPATFLANALEILLAPLLIGWIGSVYITRQHEIFLIETTDDHRSLFPHVLNIFPITHYGLLGQLGFNPHARRYGHALLDRVGRILLALTRTAVLLLFAGPILFCFANSALQLWGRFEDVEPYGLAYGVVVSAILLVQTITAVIQEFLIPFKKAFYAGEQ